MIIEEVDSVWCYNKYSIKYSYGRGSESVGVCVGEQIRETASSPPQEVADSAMNYLRAAAGQQHAHRTNS